MPDVTDTIMPAAAPVSRDRPLPAAWTVEAGLDAFLRENGYTRQQYDEPRTPASLMGIRFSVPNTPRHRWAIMLHDLHHVATGYGTDATGEGEISAWEARRGLGHVGLYVGSIIVGGVLLGLLVAPRRTLRAWRASRFAPSLFDRGAPAYEDLLYMTIGELRDRLGIPTDGLATGRRGLNGQAPTR